MVNGGYSRSALAMVVDCRHLDGFFPFGSLTLCYQSGEVLVRFFVVLRH